MTTPAATAASAPNAAPWDSDFVTVALQHRVERFYTYEARLLDKHDYATWYALLADDLHYWVPTRTNRVPREAHLEDAGPDEMAHFDDDKKTMGWRVRRLLNTMAWSEDPRSRTRHLVTNVWITPGDRHEEINASAAILVYRNRLEHDVDLFVGERSDTLRIVGDSFQISRRTVLLEQSVVLAKNIAVLL